MAYFRKDVEAIRAGPTTSFLSCYNFFFFATSDHSVGSYFRAGSVISEGQIEEPLSSPIQTSKAVIYRLKLRDHSFVPLINILGLYLLSISVDGKLRQLFSPRESSFPPTCDLSPVPKILSPYKPFMLMLPNCPCCHPTQPPGSQGRLE